LKIFTKNIFSWFLFHFLPLVCIAGLAAFRLGPSHYRMNDDSIISWLVSGSESFDQNPITVYTGIIYGYWLMFLSSSFPSYEWHGISLTISLVIIFSLLTFFIFKNKKIPKSIRIISILIIWTYTAWYIPSPTYTMSSLSLGVVAVIFLLFCILSDDKVPKLGYFLLSIFTQIISLLFRPDGYYLAVLVTSGMILYLLIFHSKSRINVLLLILNIATILSIYQLDRYLYEKEINSSRAWIKFFEFNHQYSKIKTNPAELDLYELIANEKTEKIQWDNVDALIFQGNSFFDDQVYSAEELSAGLSEIEYALGIRGLLNKDFSYSMKRTYSYLQDSQLHLVLLSFLFVSLLFFRLPYIQRLLLFFLAATPLYFAFYFLGAVSRLPLRVHFPVIIFLIIFLLVFIPLTNPILTKNYKVFLNIIGLATVISFIVSPHNFMNIRDENLRLKNNLEITTKIMKEVDSDGVFVGQILAFPETATLAYQKMPESGIRYLTSGWFTFSPPWYQKLYELELLDDDPYLALAQQPNIYWVSDAYLAEVLNMYMNNKGIIRKNLCLIETIPYKLGIYTFQSEEECSN
jgi:hypothetical protein